MECDSIKSNVNRSSTISIHAPRMECNADVIDDFKRDFHFNPRTSHGVQPHGVCVAVDAVEFQSTHPRGVRLDRSDVADAVVNFNPRTREGCDASAPPESREIVNFNPRTREGCDGRFTMPLMVFALFQSTHPRGVRPCCYNTSITF